VPAPGVLLAWHNHATVLFNTPLVIGYENLDPESAYTLGVKYIVRWGGTDATQNVRLSANGNHLIDYLIHDYMQINFFEPLKYFDLPRNLTANGQLILTWTCPNAEQGVHIAELFLIKRRD